MKNGPLPRSINSSKLRNEYKSATAEHRSTERLASIRCGIPLPAAKCYRLIDVWKSPATAATCRPGRELLLPRLRNAATGLRDRGTLSGQAQPERWDGVVRDASSIAWKPALSAALKLAIPAGVLCSPALAAGHPRSVLDGLRRNLGSGALSAQPAPGVDHYRCRARIGLVTGLLAGWPAAASQRSPSLSAFFFHNPSHIDDLFVEQVSRWSAITGRNGRRRRRPTKPVTKGAVILSPEGHAGCGLFCLASFSRFWHWYLCSRRRSAGCADAGPLAPAGGLGFCNFDWWEFRPASTTACPPRPKAFYPALDKAQEES